MCNKYNWPQVELSNGDFTSILDNLVFSGAETIVFSGGEPLMYKHLPIIKDYREDFGFGMFTTGVGQLAIDDDLLGCFDWIRISLDGDEATHNKIRGVNIYEKAVKFALRCKHLGISTRFQYTIQKENMEQFREALSTSINKFEIPMFGFFVQSVNELTWEQKELLAKDLQSMLRSQSIKDNSNIVELIEQIYTKPAVSEHCVIPQFHRVIDSDGTEWPCCYVMADNLPFDKRDMKYECSKSVHPDIFNKKTPFCETCDAIFSRYQRINDEYEQASNACHRKIYL